MDESELNKFCQAAYFQALKLRNGPSGLVLGCRIVSIGNGSVSQRYYALSVSDRNFAHTELQIEFYQVEKCRLTDLALLKLSKNSVGCLCVCGQLPKIVKMIPHEPKETTLERADFTLQLLMFVTAEKERRMFTIFFLPSFGQLLSPRIQARTG